jgi:hypothetical protein
MRTSITWMPSREALARRCTSARVRAISCARRVEMISVDVAEPSTWRRDEFTSRSIRSAAVRSSRRVR